MKYSLRQLEYFVETAERGSLAGAAQSLNISQPSLSKGIAKIEDRLGVQLFIRHHARGVSPTPAGARLLPEARNLLRHAQEFQHNAEASSIAIAGQLELSCYATIAPVFLPALVSEFTELHPQVQVRLNEGDQDGLIDGLVSGRFEMAILYYLELPSEITVLTLASFSPYVLLPPEHPLTLKTSISLAQLAEEPLILLDVPPSRRYFVDLFRRHGLEPRIAMTSPSLEVVRGFVGRGLGYSLLVTRPSFDHTYDGQETVVRPITEKTEPGNLGIAHLAEIRPTRVMQAFSDFCREWFDRHQISGGPCRFPNDAPGRVLASPQPAGTR